MAQRIAVSFDYEIRVVHPVHGEFQNAEEISDSPGTQAGDQVLAKHTECLDRIVPLGEKHLRAAERAFMTH